jgi:signal transduction histidine kinase
LIDDYRRAGLRIEVGAWPDLRSVGAAVGVGLHRIVREALANIAQHAPTNAVRVDVVVGDSEVRVSVCDRGRPPVLASGGVAHFGLVGMGERARALGGVVTAGPTGDGWSVEAILPLGRAPADVAGSS